jgi:hypothetical protein
MSWNLIPRQPPSDVGQTGCAIGRPHRTYRLSLAEPSVRMSLFTEAHLKQVIIVAALALVATAPARSQALVDPTKVAPEYREAAEKRRAEQVRQRECALKADLDKVLPRDRTVYLNHCLEAMAAKQ